MSDPSDRRSTRPSRRPPPGAGLRGDDPGAREDDPAPDSTPSTRVVGEDFLYHLYRGSELLQDNCVAEAKEELERALAVQPRDAEGQALLGVVYFRLGLYPRAIEIFDELLRTFPHEVAPRMNLALCFLKTGQQHRAREQLEAVVQRAPEHRRAWGYLGLVLERLGELARAEAAFVRAGQSGMARRMRLRLEEATSPVAPGDADALDVQRAAEAAVAELELDPSPFFRAEATEVGALATSLGRWEAHEPGRDPALVPRRSVPPPSLTGTPRTPPPSIGPVRSAPPAERPAAPPGPSDPRAPTPPAPPPALEDVAGLTPSELVARHLLVEPPTGLGQHGAQVVVVRARASLVVRGTAVRALIPDGAPFRASPAYRRARGRALDEVLGGAEAALGELAGSGRVVLVASGATARLVPIQLSAGELLYLREAFLVAFEGSVHHESGRLPRGDAGYHSMVQLSGDGAVVVELDGHLHAVPVEGEGTVAVVSDHVVGWTGRLFPKPLDPAHAPGGGRGYVGFSGEGSVLVAFE